MGGTFELEKLETFFPVDGGRVRSSPEKVAPSALARVSATQQPKTLGLENAELVRKFGTGENLVLQLRLFRDKDLFAFRFGCFVCWSFTEPEYLATKERLRRFMSMPLPSQDDEEEKMEFKNSESRSKRWEEEDDEEEEKDSDENETESPTNGANSVRQDQIILSTTNPLEKLAHSYALAQSVRLGVFETVVDLSIANTRSIPERMAATGEVDLDARDLSKQMGGLLMIRCDVNLHTDILDTPEIFWDEERFEPHYKASREYLEVDKRVEILNQRLSVLKDLYDLLQNGLNVKHGNKLEVIIIVLILVEVVLELLELLHDAWTK